MQLDSASRLTASARDRLVELLTARATEFHALGRGIPESADLETVARLRDHEIEISCDPARSQHHKGHASDEHRVKAERTETPHDFADRLKVIDWIGHFTVPVDRSLAAVR